MCAAFFYVLCGPRKIEKISKDDAAAVAVTRQRAALSFAHFNRKYIAFLPFYFIIFLKYTNKRIFYGVCDAAWWEEREVVRH